MLTNIITQDAMTVVVDGQNFVVPKDHPHYGKVREAVYAGDIEAFHRHYSEKKKLEAVLNHLVMEQHDVEIKNGMLYYNGEALHSTLTRRILDLHADSVPVDSLMSFLCNLMENPSYNSKTQLYEYLERNHIPITEDGCFLAYKYVSDNYKSCHVNLDGTYNDNTPGKTVKMNRGLVDDNTNNGCSSGLHVGSFSYVNPGSQKTVVVKVNPKNVVSVPTDCSYTKIRVCEYEVMYEYKIKLEDNYYDASGEQYDTSVYSEDDETVCTSDFNEQENHVEYDDLLIGQKIAFVYEKRDGSVSNRVARVETIFDRNIIGYMSDIEEFRTFIKTGMSDITLLS